MMLHLVVLIISVLMISCGSSDDDDDNDMMPDDDIDVDEDPMAMQKDTVATPLFSLGSGTYDTAQELVIETTTVDATIKLSINEVLRESAVYTGPILFNENGTFIIKSIAIRDDWADSDSTSVSIIIDIPEEVIEDPVSDPSCLLQTISFGGTSYDSLVYNANNQLVELYELDNESDNVTKRSYEYTGSKIIERRSESSTGIINLPQATEIAIEYTVDANDNIVRIDYMLEGSSDVMELFYELDELDYIKYFGDSLSITTDDGNIVAIQTYDENGNIEGTRTYSYDNKNNGFYGAFLLIAADGFPDIDFLPWGFSENNFTLFDGSSYTYTYDDNDYPSQILVPDGGDFSIWNLIYTCN